MRSRLIARADEQRLAKGLERGADAIIVDLAGARFLKEARGQGGGPVLIVRANALDSGETDSDLDAVMAGGPDAILLPGSLGASSVQQLSAKLAVREAQLGLADGATRIIAVADRAQSLFHMGSYRGSSARLIGIAWSAEALRADIGAETDRDRLGDTFGPVGRGASSPRPPQRSPPLAATAPPSANIRAWRACAPRRWPRGATV